MRLLITGANGYIGSNLVKKFNRSGEFDVIPQSRSICDLMDRPSLEKNLGSKKVDYVIHTAAKANSVEYKNSLEVLQNNIISTQNLIETFPKANHIFFSSIVVYSSAHNFYKSTSKVGARSVYGASKAACEQLYSAAKHISGTKSCMLRCCAVVGGSNYTHGLVNAIINKCKENPNEIELFGKRPGTIKPYIHIDDVYGRILNIIKCGYFPKTDVLATSYPLSVEQVANIVFDKLGVYPKINWRPDKVWKGDNKTINYKGKTYGMLYQDSESALKNMDVEVY
jgi:UDP-glucose 4-epimerase